NAARLRALYKQIEAAYAAKRAMAEYFAENQTLMGYQGPGVPSIDDFYAALESVPDPFDGGMLGPEIPGIPDYLSAEDKAIWEVLDENSRAIILKEYENE
ncbi:MAG: hypothetical protein AAF125_00770, partial [Chloroflexota bacterium]